MRSPRIAANPIPYWSKAGKSREVFEQAFRDFSDIGYTAVKADIPEGMTAAEYLEWIGGYGLAPALSLFNSPFDETLDPATELESAKRFAADQASLGLDRAMVSSMAVPARLARPAVGADFDEGRLARAIERCGRVCEALQQNGIRPLHHSHIGGVFETESEIVRLLDDLGPDVIGVGPDTGHLRWAGIDPAEFIARYADRVGGIHIKDCFPDYLDHTDERSYHGLTETKRLWAEPGLGVVDFDAVLAALPDDYDGDLMIEIDEPSVDSRYESHRMAFEWAQKGLAR
ncbi:MAG TPA: sugar phosphate isomerase/epimerase [Lapillicoccus sp.]|nr:sugar phosphate isomerase/epimerase [Lapillicoccus sp.]